MRRTFRESTNAHGLRAGPTSLAEPVRGGVGVRIIAAEDSATKVKPMSPSPAVRPCYFAAGMIFWTRIQSAQRWGHVEHGLSEGRMPKPCPPVE